MLSLLPFFERINKHTNEKPIMQILLSDVLVTVVAIMFPPGAAVRIPMTSMASIAEPVGRRRFSLAAPASYVCRYS
jgi:hypothetical protein